MAGHFLYKIKDVLEDLNYLNWVQRTEEKMEKEISNQGGGVCVGHSQAYGCKIFVQVGFLRKSRSQNTVLVRF